MINILEALSTYEGVLICNFCIYGVLDNSFIQLLHTGSAIGKFDHYAMNVATTLLLSVDLQVQLSLQLPGLKPRSARV